MTNECAVRGVAVLADIEASVDPSAEVLGLLITRFTIGASDSRTWPYMADRSRPGRTLAINLGARRTAALLQDDRTDSTVPGTTSNPTAQRTERSHTWLQSTG